MVIQSAIKKIKKGLDISIEKTDYGVYYGEYKNYIISFMNNGGQDNVTCISTRKKNDLPDSQSDYYPQCWHNNITQAIKFLLRK